MIIKKEFELLNNTPNILRYSAGIIKANSIPGDRINLVRRIKLLERRVNHYTSKKVFEITSGIREIRRHVSVVNMDYPLFVSYNLPTKRIILNLNPYGVDEISRVDEKALYASLVYGIAFRDLVTKKINIKDIYFIPITNWLTTLFVQIYGKDYGLLGSFQQEIAKLKFLIACYIQTSFFGIDGTLSYKRAATISAVDYKNIQDKLDKYNFGKTTDFIKALSELKVLPGFNIIIFANKLYKFLGINTLPAFEDCSRFISTIITSNITGSTIIPTFIGKKYNRDEFGKILEIGKLIFK